MANRVVISTEGAAERPRICAICGLHVDTPNTISATGGGYRPPRGLGNYLLRTAPFCMYRSERLSFRPRARQRKYDVSGRCTWTASRHPVKLQSKSCTPLLPRNRVAGNAGPLLRCDGQACADVWERHSLDMAHCRRVLVRARRRGGGVVALQKRLMCACVANRARAAGSWVLQDMLALMDCPISL
jgi:hypothetical protein